MESGMKQPAPAGNRLSKDASLTLVLQGLFTFAYALSNTFLNLYLWRLTPGNPGYIVIFAMTFLFYFATGLLSRRIQNVVPARKTYYLRHMAIVFRRNPAWRDKLLNRPFLPCR